MYWILAIMATLAAGLLALVVGGLVTPADYRVVRQVTLHRTAHDVRALLADLAAYEKWMPTPSTIERTAADDATAGIALRVTDDDTKAQRQWEWGVAADTVTASDHCTVTLTEWGRVGNPVLRFVGALRGHGGHAERALRALAEHFDEFGIAVERVDA